MWPRPSPSSCRPAPPISPARTWSLTVARWPRSPRDRPATGTGAGPSAREGGGGGRVDEVVVEGGTGGAAGWGRVHREDDAFVAWDEQVLEVDVQLAERRVAEALAAAEGLAGLV